MALFKDGRFTPDPWRRADGIADLPPEGYVIMTVESWRHLDTLSNRRNVAFGLLLEPSQPVETIAEDLPYLALVALQFPKFTDGRGFSQARQIRERYGFTGELRATGEVLFDQLQFMARCGFDAFEITDPVTIKLLEEGRSPITMHHYYQPGDAPEAAAGVSPWRRQPLRKT
ncbi:MAG TPA: DUF934 domain-containing protein [Methylovirgula sp.]|nr:DUF934 domain-containing protein [Methylovirgula sp.]